MSTLLPTDAEGSEIHSLKMAFTKGSKILVVGAQPYRHFSQYLKSGRVELWTLEELGRKSALPPRVELVVRMRFSNHKDSECIENMCRNTEAILLVGVYNTGQVHKLIRRFLGPPDGKSLIQQVVPAEKVGERVASIMRRHINYDAPDKDRELRRLSGVVRRNCTNVPDEVMRVIFNQVIARRPGPVVMPAPPQVIYQSPTPATELADVSAPSPAEVVEAEVVAQPSTLADVESVTEVAVPNVMPPVETVVSQARDTTGSGPVHIIADASRLFGETCVMGEIAPLQDYSGTVTPFPDGSFKFPPKQPAFVPDAFGTGRPVQPKSRFELAIELLQEEADHHRALAEALETLIAQFAKG